ncbi:MAG TPA: tyrosine-type recombinase/integrase [Pseudonocardia sp.]|jgi:integrase|nr:tyrosine-type recombinase/integrase [Pseudonocardia sp.]
MAGAKGRARKQRGSIDELPSGALRVRVYGGKDPVSGRRHDLVEVIPPGPRAWKEAEAARTRFLNQVDEKRHPRTSATVNQLLDRHMETLDLERTTRTTYVGYLKNHVRPFIGDLKVGAFDAEAIDSLIAELRRCRRHCPRRAGGLVDHRTPRPHDCDDRCRPHACRPLANSSVRQILFLLSGAYDKAVRWRWVSVNPVALAAKPPAPRPDPQPPTAEDAARIINEAWRDPDWGTMVWLTMVTGSRRGELCALRWFHIDLSAGVVTIRRALSEADGELEEKDTKTHQKRRITIDPQTVEMLTEHWDRCVARAASLGLTLSRDAFVFSNAPDGSEPLKPSSVTQRYGRLAARLGIETHLHALRHYSATELIAAGVDVRTVAGRLGHSGGGATTLRVYAAWLSEVDQRAAAGLLARMPERPQPETDPIRRAKVEPRTPAEHLAADLRGRILSGEYPVGSELPPMKQLAADHQLAAGTVHRAVTLLKEWGLVEASRGRRACVIATEQEAVPARAVEPILSPTAQSSGSLELLDLAIRYRGQDFRRLSARADPHDADVLHRLLTGALRRAGRDETDIGDYEMDVQIGDHLVTTFVDAG